MINMVKTWQVGVITFLICSLVFTPIGIIIAVIMYKRSVRESDKRLDPEKFRKAYKVLWDDMV